MTSKPLDFPSVRLFAAGCLTLLLLVWIAFFDDSWQYGLATILAASSRPFDALGALITAALSALTLAILIPIALRGRTTDRWLAVILAIFPFIIILLLAVGPLFVHAQVRI